MGRQFRFTWMAVALLVALGTAAAVAAGGGGGFGGGGGGGGWGGPGAPEEQKKISMALKDVPVVEAIEVLTKDTNISYAYRGEPPKDRRVNITFNNADVNRALRLVCAAAGLDCDYTPWGYVISVPPTVTVGGGEVPIYGAVSWPGYGAAPWRGGGGGGGGGVGRVFGDQRIVALTSRAPGPSFNGATGLVDLNVEEATFPDVMSQLSKASGVAIRVDQSVSKDLKVTAKVYRMPFRELLCLLLEQSNLTYTLDQTREDEPQVHIVPKPELRVSGPGVGLEGVKAWMEAHRAGESVLETLGALEKRTGQKTTSLGFRLCPECGDQVMRPDWKFCPHCGAELPAEQQAEKND